MNKKTHFSVLIISLAALLFAACSDKEGPSEPSISFSLDWADSTDEGIVVSDTRAWVFQYDGKLVAENQSSTNQGKALDIYAVDGGEYMMVAVVNMVAPFSVAKSTTSNDLVFKLEDASSSPPHAYFSVTSVSVKTDKRTQATLSLRRILSEFSIEVEGAPRGTTLVATINNVADGIWPLQKDADGNFGRATNGYKNIVTIPEATTIGGAISTQTMRLMPTALDAATRANDASSNLQFVFTDASGRIMKCNAEGPAMKTSGKYSLKMKYSELKPYMRIDPVKINDWEEGWIVSGEILNPDK